MFSKNFLEICGKCILKRICFNICKEYENEIKKIKNNFIRNYTLSKRVTKCLLCDNNLQMADSGIYLKSKLNYKCCVCGQKYYIFVDYVRLIISENFLIEICMDLNHFQLHKNGMRLYSSKVIEQDV